MIGSAIDYNKKVCIVGFAGTSRGLVPYSDRSFEVWSLNNAHSFVERWDRWFEMHKDDIIGADFVRDGQHQSGSERYKWLIEQPGVGHPDHKPIYMIDKHPMIPASVKFPREELNAWFGSYGLESGWVRADGYASPDYYTSSIAQMLALAVAEGYGEIHVYGVDMLQEEEYYYQRAGCEYYIAFARGRGHRVYVPEQSALCDAGYVYGYSEPPATGQYDSLLEFIGRQKTEAEVHRNEAQCVAHRFEGSLRTIKDIRAKLEDRLNSTRVMCDTCAKISAYLDSTEPTVVVERDKALYAANLHEGARQMSEAMTSWVGHTAKGGRL